MHLARTVRALDQLMPDIGCLAGTGHNHGIARLPECRIAKFTLSRFDDEDIVIQSDWEVDLSRSDLPESTRVLILAHAS